MGFINKHLFTFFHINEVVVESCVRIGGVFEPYEIRFFVGLDRYGISAVAIRCYGSDAHVRFGKGGGFIVDVS